MDQTFKSKATEPEPQKEVVFTGVEAGQEWTICCWDLKSRSVKSSYKGNSSKAQTLCVFNGEYVMSADSCKPLIHIWPLNRRDHCLRIRSPGLATAIALTSDGIYCAAATSYKIYIWLVSTGELMTVFDSNQVNYMQFSRNSRYLLSGGSTTVCVWPLAKVLANGRNDQSHIECVYKFTHGNSVTGLKCGTTTVLTSADRTVNVWSLRDGQLLRTFILDSLVSALEWSQKEDRAYAGTYDGEIYEVYPFCEQETPKKFVYARGEKKQAHTVAGKNDRRVTCLSLSLDGGILVAGSLRGKVYLWNTRSRHLVTSVCLNAKSLITSCVVASVPLNLEKPIHPVASFQAILAEKCDEKVKFVLTQQEHDGSLDFEIGDEKFEKYVSKGFSLLEDLGRAANKGEQFARNWIRLTEHLLFGLHKVIDQLYANVESGSIEYQRPAEGQVDLKPCKEETPERLTLLCAQFEKLCTCLSAMISAHGLDFPVVVDFPLKFIVDFLCRTAAVTPPYLLKKQTPERMSLAEVIPRLHTAALGVFQSLINSVKSLLLPYSEIVNNLLVLPCLTWSKLNGVNDSKRKASYISVRTRLYSVVELLLKHGLSGDSKAFESFFKTVICEAVNDAKPVFESQKVDTKSDLAANRASSHWMQYAKNKLNLKTKDMAQELDKDESRAFLRLNVCALKVLQRMVVSEGCLLPRYILETIADLLKSVYASRKFSEEYNVTLRKLVASVVMVIPSLPFALELPLEFTTPGHYSDDDEELRQLYISSLRRQMPIAVAENSFGIVPRDGEATRFHEAVKQIEIEDRRLQIPAFATFNSPSLLKRKLRNDENEQELIETSESQLKKQAKHVNSNPTVAAVMLCDASPKDCSIVEPSNDVNLLPLRLDETMDSSRQTSEADGGDCVVMQSAVAAAVVVCDDPQNTCSNADETSEQNLLSLKLDGAIDSSHPVEASVTNDFEVLNAESEEVQEMKMDFEFADPDD